MKQLFLVFSLIVARVTTVFAQQGILDFERFKQEIEPLLTITTYSLPAAGTTCISCHGNTSNTAYDEYPLVLGESRDNFVESARQIVLENPAISPILLKPLSQAAGGSVHGTIGNEQFVDTEDANYQTLLTWIEDATRSTIGATVSESVPYPNPFRFSTDIVYFLTTEARFVELILFSTSGYELRRFTGTTNVGANRVTWDGRDRDGDPLPTGAYVYSIHADFDEASVVHNGTVVFTP